MKFLFYFCKQFSLHIYIFELNFKKSAGRRVFLWKSYFCSATWVERRLIIHISSYHNNVMHKIKFIWIFFLLPTLMLMMMICSVDAQVLCECTIKPLLFSLSLLKFAFFRRNVLCSYMYVTHSTSLVAVASVVSHRHKQMFSFTKKNFTLSLF